MAWEWSHTNDAYADARAQVDRLPRRVCLEVLREWTYDDREKRGGSRRQGSVGPTGRVRGFRLPPGVARLPVDVLRGLVWDRAAEHRTCSNGGGEAYLCPDGCHTVPFAAPEGREP